MRLVIIKMLIVLLAFSFGCDRVSEESKSNSQEVGSSEMETRTQNSESDVDIQEVDNQEVDNQEVDIQEVDSSGTAIDKNTETSNDSNLNSFADQESTKDFPAENNQKSLIFNDGRWSLFEVVIITSLLLNLILIVLFISLFRKNSRLNKDINTKNHKLDNKNWRIRELERDLQQKNNSYENQFQQNNKKINERKRFQDSRSKSGYVDQKPYEVILDHKITTPPSITVEAMPKVILYAGKPSDANTFSAVSSQQDEHRSIFKLILENKEAESAKFEVVENEYIMKMIANSPDTYLYSVCNPENSNQNFDGRILTTKKGIAYLADGEWRVNDEDKATIKFQ